MIRCERQWLYARRQRYKKNYLLGYTLPLIQRDIKCGKKFFLYKVYRKLLYDLALLRNKQSLKLVRRGLNEMVVLMTLRSYWRSGRRVLVPVVPVEEQCRKLGLKLFFSGVSRRHEHRYEWRLLAELVDVVDQKGISYKHRISLYAACVRNKRNAKVLIS